MDRRAAPLPAGELPLARSFPHLRQLPMARAARKWCRTVSDPPSLYSSLPPRALGLRARAISRSARPQTADALQSFPLPPGGFLEERGAKLKQGVGALQEGGEDGVSVFVLRATSGVASVTASRYERPYRVRRHGQEGEPARAHPRAAPEARPA